MKTHSHALGVDIGGTKIAIGVVSANGDLLAARTIATDSQKGIADATERITEAVQLTLKDCAMDTKEMAGIGVGCAGPVSPLHGMVINPYTLPGWENWNLVQSLSSALGLPVWLENDADMAGLGEYYYGAGQGLDRLVMLTVGTGVGGSVLCEGQIYRGAGGEHPEIGHLPVSDAGNACYCGSNGCVESFISGTAIALAGRPFGFDDAASVFAGAADSSDARRILASVQRGVEAAVWSILHTFLPDRIVLGGGLVEFNQEFFLNAGRAGLDRIQLVDCQVSTIECAQLGNRAGIIGAARYAMEQKARLAGNQPGAVSEDYHRHNTTQ